MGWVAGNAFRPGVGSVASAARVEEATGFTGDRVTPTGQSKGRTQAEKFTIPRRGRIVHATKSEALAEAKP